MVKSEKKIKISFDEFLETPLGKTLFVSPDSKKYGFYKSIFEAGVSIGKIKK